MADINQLQLDKFYKQSTDQYVSYDANEKNATYQEVWKNNLSAVMGIYSKIQSFKPASATDIYTYSKFLADIGEGNLHYYYDKPAAPDGAEWSLINAEINELEAGDNAELRLTWGIATTTVDPEEEPVFETRWGLTWQTYTVPVYAYCGNTGSHKTSDDDKQMRGEIASRDAVERWFNGEESKIKYNFKYPTGTHPEPLNPAEVNIAKKLLQSKTNIVFHYPILSKTSTTIVPKSRLSAVLASDSVKSLMTATDVIINPQTPIPVPKIIGEDKDWTWISNGSSVNVSINEKTKNVTVQVTTTYNGSIDADKNFYGTGTDRWILGKA